MKLALLFAMIGLALATIALLNASETNNGLPLVQSAIRESDEPSLPAWRLLPVCPVDRRNVPTLPPEYEA